MRLEAQLLQISVNAHCGGMALHGWDKKNPLGHEVSLSTEMLDRIQEEFKGPRTPIELIAVAAEDKNQREILSLFGMDEKRCSSLRKLLRISVYVMKFIKMKVWSQLGHEKYRCFSQFKLIVTVFEVLRESEPISFREIKIVS